MDDIISNASCATIGQTACAVETAYVVTTGQVTEETAAARPAAHGMAAA